MPLSRALEQHIAVFGESGSGKTVLLSSFYGATQEPQFLNASLFDVVADDTYTAEMIYYGSFLPLSDSCTSNALLVRAPDAYLYGALVASAPFLASDERLQVWEQLYGTARDGLLLSDRQSRFGTPLVSRLSGAIP